MFTALSYSIIWNNWIKMAGSLDPVSGLFFNFKNIVVLWNQVQANPEKRYNNIGGIVKFQCCVYPDGSYSPSRNSSYTLGSSQMYQFSVRVCRFLLVLLFVSKANCESLCDGCTIWDLNWNWRWNLTDTVTETEAKTVTELKPNMKLKLKLKQDGNLSWNLSWK